MLSDKTTTKQDHIKPNILKLIVTASKKRLKNTGLYSKADNLYCKFYTIKIASEPLTTILPLFIRPINSSHIRRVNMKAKVPNNVLLGNRGTLVLATSPELLPEGAPAGSRTRDLSIMSLAC